MTLDKAAVASESGGRDLSLSENPQKRPGHFPALDGLRGVAVTMIFFAHYTSLLPANPVVWWGITGVDLFFVLSGFLITGILFDSLEAPDFFRNFYLRRTLRIFPLYYGVWLAIVLLSPWIHPMWNRWVLTNVYYASDLLSSGAGHPDPGILIFRHGQQFPRIIVGHFWTLSVEEQFYFFWPAMVYFVRDRVKLLRVCVAIILFEPVLRTVLFEIWHHHGENVRPLYYFPLMRVDSLLIGAAGVLWLRSGIRTAGDVRRLKWLLLIGPPALLCLLMETIGRGHAVHIENAVYCTVGFTLLSLTALGLVLACVEDKSGVARALRLSWLRSLGAVSYGFYVFHCLYLDLIFQPIVERQTAGVKMLIFVFFFGMTYVLGRLSYIYYESIFLRWRSVLSERRDMHPAVVS